ncbi:MAG: hypothetical protein SFZ03_10165 [Candidatus Melainabacteria bacterium]|nr:hypothetical protein [Candidatus Melainabacteria bacterium]
MDILAGGDFGVFVQALLHTLKSLEAHQRLMLALSQRNAPFPLSDIPRIGSAGEDFPNPRRMHPAFAVFVREVRLAFKKALHLGLHLETTGGKTFHCFRNYGGERLQSHQYFSMPRHFAVGVTFGRGEDVIALFQPGTHFLDDLALVLLALQLPLRSKNGLHKLAFGAVIKLVVQAFDFCPAHVERFA